MGITAEYSMLINLTIKSVLKSSSLKFLVKILLKLKRKNTSKRESEVLLSTHTQLFTGEISLFTVGDGKKRVCRATIHCTLADDIAQMIN